jgi:hypothetical protein
MDCQIASVVNDYSARGLFDELPEPLQDWYYALPHRSFRNGPRGTGESWLVRTT